VGLMRRHAMPRQRHAAAWIVLLAAALALAVIYGPVAVTGQQWPLPCTAGSSAGVPHTTMGALAWDNTGTHYLSMNMTDGTVICEFGFAAGDLPFGEFNGAQVTADTGSGVVYSILGGGDGAAVLYAVDVVGISVTQLCRFTGGFLPLSLSAAPSDLSPDLRTGRVDDDNDDSVQLLSTGFEGDSSLAMGWVDPSTCDVTVVARHSLTGWVDMVANAVEWRTGTSTGTGTGGRAGAGGVAAAAVNVTNAFAHVMLRPGDSNAAFMVSFELSTRTSRMLNISFPGADHWAITLLIAPPSSSLVAPAAAAASSHVYAYAVDVDGGFNGTRYWGSLNTVTGRFTPISQGDYAALIFVSGATEAIPVDDDRSRWRVQAFGEASDPNHMANQLYEFELDSGRLVSTSTGSVVSMPWQLAWLPQPSRP
jgi:hypothetical protein